MKKFLSLILALTLVASLFTVNVMAASKAHTVTITPDKTTGLKAGDTVTIELTVDNTESLVSFAYELTYDTTAFTADNTKVNRLEACIDKPWLDDIKDADADWAYYLGNPTYNVKNAGAIKFGWAGAEGVEADYAVDNRVVGKFYLKVNEGVADGTYTFALTGDSMDAGENSKANLVCAPVTVKVGADAPAVVDPTFEATTNMGTNGVVAGDKIYDNALAVETTINAGTNTTEVGIVFAPKAWLAGATLVADKAGVRTAAKTDILGAGEVSIKAAIKDIPRLFEGKDIVMVTVPYAFDGTDYAYGAEVETIVNFANTGE
jgi:hypothetical protein